MPFRNRMGPRGLGPRTGKGMGPCGSGYGPGLGWGRGYGRTMCGWFYREYQNMNKEEKEKILKEELKDLKNEIEMIEKELDQLKK